MKMKCHQLASLEHVNMDQYVNSVIDSIVSNLCHCSDL